jgi:hypothetical protein
MRGISLAFSISSMFFVLVSVVVLEGPTPRAVEGEAWTPSNDDDYTPTDILLSDMTLSAIRSVKNSSTTFSTTLSSSDIQAWVH